MNFTHLLLRFFAVIISGEDRAMVSHSHKNEIVRPLQMENTYSHEIRVIGKSVLLSS